ncbi:MAG TPA: hypothetical protein PLK12_09110 [Prolixibacteraceae bacterium]|nr:hypothetical protein [Prolixibacteraceae bacterium]
MKRLIFFSLPLSAFPYRSLCQDFTDTIKLWTPYPGYIIILNEDTIVGFILLKNKIANQGNESGTCRKSSVNTTR